MNDIRLSERVQLGPPEAVAAAAVDGEWFSDSEDMRLSGYGKGMVGRVRATQGLRDALRAQSSNFKVLGVYQDGSPVGLFWLEYKGDIRKAVEMHCFIGPTARGKWAFHVAGTGILDMLFSQGVYRVEAEPLRINKRMIQLLRHYGFKQEGVKRSSYWMDGNDYDTVLMRLLKREWKKWKES